MDARVAKVVEFIQANLGRPLRVSDLAAVAGISESRLWHLLKKDTGLSPAKYMTVQIHAGARLLETLSVKQIAYAVGFNDDSHFVRAFKRISRLTPGEFRRRRQAESERKKSATK